MKRCVLFAVVLWLAPLEAQERSRDLRDVQGLVAQARGVPPEFSADALIQIATSGAIASRVQRRELLEDAFMRAYVSQEAYRRSTGTILQDTRQSADMRAGETGMTRVSLQLRAVVALAPLDPVRARELFEWIDPHLVVGGCAEALTPVVDDYYAALTSLARTTFPGDAIGRGAALQFFETFIWRAHLPTEIPAVVRALLRFRPDALEAAHLQTVFVVLLESVFRDPRGFSTAGVDMVSKTIDLEDAHRALGLTGLHVVRALRRYLVASLTSPRCSDSLSDEPAVAVFNAYVRRLELFKDGIQPIAASEVRPLRVLGGARFDPYWRTPDARRLFDQGVKLRGRERDAAAAARTRNSADWLEQAGHLVSDLEHWTGAREAHERDYFYQKSILYTLLVDLTPPGPLRMRMLRSYADSLRRADMDRVGRALWFAFAKRLIELTHSDDRALVVSLLDQSPSAVLALYGRLDRLQSVEQADR